MNFEGYQDVQTMNISSTVDRIRAGEGVILMCDPLDDETYPSFLSPEDFHRYSSFSHAPSRQAFLTGRWVLYQVLSAFVSEPVLDVGVHGKPSCPHPEAPAFNLSHTGSDVAVVFHTHGPVGVDIEPADRVPTHMDHVARRVFTEQERTYLKADPDCFMTLWTRKEAVLKTMGEGFTAGASSVETSTYIEQKGWSLSSFHRTGLVGAVCVPQGVRLMLGTLVSV